MELKRHLEGFNYTGVIIQCHTNDIIFYLLRKF